MGEKSTVSIRSYVLDAFFPRFCLMCRTLLSIDPPNTYVCTACRELILPSTESRCAFCPRQTPRWEVCPACRPSHALDRLLVAADYGDLRVKRMVKALKYRYATPVAADIGTMMQSYLESRLPLLGLTRGELILTSIPLHPRRLRSRGFNQAALIAEEIGKHLGIRVYHDILLRTEHKTPQADIKNREARIKNADGIFETKIKKINYKNILLIDDVATTGATLDAAARILKHKGVEHVIGAVFARGG